MNKHLRRAISALCMSLLLVPLLPFSVPAEEEQQEEQASQKDYTDYAVSGVGDLEALAELCRLDSASRNLRVTLKADIDLKGHENLMIPTFGGIFDGQNHKIYGIAIEQDGSARGLFRYIQQGATVKNLQLIGRVTPAGSSTQVGGLVGVNAGTLENISFYGAVCGASQVGGIVGVNQVSGRIDSCTMKGYIRGSKSLGGIVGENQGVVYNCVNKANVNTVLLSETLSIEDITVPRITSDDGKLNGSDIGGVAGASSGVLRLCRNEGNVGYPHTGYNIGGVAGSSSGFMADCVNYGEVQARKEGGGVLGQMEPNNMLVYSEDTLQKLETELQTAQGILNRAAYDAGQANATIQNGLVDVEASMNNTLNAIDYLLGVARDNTTITPPDEDDWLPDFDISDSGKDEIWAAAGTLGDQMGNLVWQISSVSQSAAEQGGQVISDLQSLSSQMQRVISVMSGREENENLMQDVSGDDMSQDSAGKIRDCINYGAVYADINAGGIVGALSRENSLDPEDDLSIEGETSLNFTFLTRALVYQCQNRGLVQAKKQCAGGIAGRSTLGAVVACQSYGTVDSPDASWVGGIIGRSKNQISQNWAKCHVSGNSLVGGIAGEASQLEDNRALITLENPGEFSGAICGKLTEGGESSGNFFVETPDLGGIDGISYDGSAQPISYPALMKLENVPEYFGKMVLTFVAEEETFTRRVNYNGTLKDVPEVPEKEGYNGIWADFDPEHIQSDKTVNAEYTALQAAADTGSETGQLPIALAQGAFVSGEDIATQELTDLPQGATFGIRLTLPEDGETSHTIRLRMPDKTKSYHLYVKDGGDWQETDYTQDGSYLTFPAQGTELDVALKEKTSATPILLVTAAAALALLSALLLILRKKRKKKKQV